MNSKKIYSMISLCAKAGRLVSGNFSVEKAVKNGSACAVIVACDAAHNTKKIRWKRIPDVNRNLG